MSQPPVSRSPSRARLGFIGAGRLARCLALGFARAGHPVVAVASRSAASAQALAGRIDGCAALDSAQQVVDTADVIFLTVPDDAIGSTANALRFDHDETGDASRLRALVHCSGASPIELLAPAREQGASIGGFHPLFLFGGSDADLDRIAGCSVTLEADGARRDELSAVLTDLVGALGCHPLSIPPGGRMLYHGAAHYAASFAICALSECVALWRTLGFADDDALRALMPMLEGTLATAREKGLANALAGPVSRGDASLVDKQMATFESLGGDHAALYGLMTRRALALAGRRATPPATLDAMSASLEISLERALDHARTGASVK